MGDNSSLLLKQALRMPSWDTRWLRSFLPSFCHGFASVVTLFTVTASDQSLSGAGGPNSRVTSFIFLYPSHNFFKNSAPVVSKLWTIHVKIAPEVLGSGEETATITSQFALTIFSSEN